jgi:hypothetical protein
VQVNLFNTALDNQNAIVIGPLRLERNTPSAICCAAFREGRKSSWTWRHLPQRAAVAQRPSTTPTSSTTPARLIEFNPFIVPLGRFGQKWLWRRETSFLALLSALWKGDRDTGLDKSGRTILSRFPD